ncbi:MULTISPECIES: RsmB/NOP family class I SAM-dependent RNA methyltransferase [unclassified Breznakia]|uniref:RsmB/NOP family class I SAM-dependent RNA methyltransferase n=1 Tax=unclassified Breznakia TaxID=2623764 RepID=UPI0024743B64|nr:MULTISPECIES: RsmB/NOP family class I SAM-dependent RNA methyltransferase [unclassified Breznakia]MDH6367003.1 NOL1/NOP2/sun family putative RNA methylase [Breznakia sp. PH1-1]MDH6404225.1 NOL1/NOP2/sun family putative RNA methylase [Breznakia sp. PF1-11]MDH6411890.1 NOL1/NOP2/sun family putative RNA methylase [Breznakia sp. PFB1-11]MDH6414213.1 NOL1/NOP2/sun family putative RNA methylase [Breznakia sp. PFB1-14]MDH6415963.1 NOL1/NOP2/sun family putative RNA methylase [Breznakia sp. PFB1-4]
MNKTFLDRMQTYLGDEYEAYIASLEKPLYKGIRNNTLKDSKDLLEQTFQLEPSKFNEDGYSTLEDISGKHPLHKMGCFYMQEPSAMSVVQIADIQKGDWVLDMCAAPGGKSTQIASKLQHTGCLVSNEYVGKRATILMSNLERMGVGECIITNASTKQLAAEFMGIFDKVIVDAPCSGEGMMKKHDIASQEWSEANVLACAKRQKDILEDAYLCVKENGVLVYSTCTYAKEENEYVVDAFLEAHPDMELLAIEASFGREGYDTPRVKGAYVRRIFPMDDGEGHFIAKLRKKGTQETKKLQLCKTIPLPKEVEAFLLDQIGDIDFYCYQRNNHVYIKKSPFIDLANIHVLRQGIEVGEIIKGRLEPHQHFYMAATLQNKFQHKITVTEEQLSSFLQGNVLMIPCEKGYVALMYEGYAVGFGKSDGKQIKNKYPKGLRIR